jgi:hypothetical protein
MQRRGLKVFGLAVLAGALASWSVPAPHGTAAEPAEITGWSVKLTTDGGFAGTGRGNITLTSDGKLGILDREGKKVVREEKAPADKLAAIERSIKECKPADWKDAYNEKAADAFSYNLELRVQRGGKEEVHRVMWNDPGANKLPRDVQQLYAGLAPLLRQR